MGKPYPDAFFDAGPQERPRDFNWGENTKSYRNHLRIGGAVMAASFGVLLFGQANASSPDSIDRYIQAVEVKHVEKSAKHIKIVIPEYVMDVKLTEDVRDCIAAIEVRGQAEPYLAENGGTPEDEPGSHRTTASGRYQFIDSTWVAMRDRAARYYKKPISRAEHAAFAPPIKQDQIAAYTLLHENSQWRWSKCNAMAQNLKSKLKNRVMAKR